jgi:hypothetical protein
MEKNMEELHQNSVKLLKSEIAGALNFLIIPSVFSEIFWCNDFVLLL